MGGNLHQSFGTRLSWRLQSLALRLVLPLLRGRSHSRMERVVHRMLRCARPLIRGRVAAAATGLKRVYGDSLDPAQRTALAERSLEHFLLACLESVIRPEDDRIVARGEGLETLLHRPPGQGAIVASLHLGCWDVALRWLSQQRTDLAVIYRPIDNPDVDRLLNQARSGNSRCHWISRSDPRAMLAWLRRGGTLVLMSDLHAHENFLEVDMLGRLTRLSRGPFRLAQATGCPIFPAAHVRHDDGSFLVHVGAPLAAGAEGLERLAQELCDWQEPWIHEYAEQYLWAYPRWRRGEGARLREVLAPAPRVLNLVRD